MAEVITRLKLESGEYDSKIKRAVTGLQQMESECRKVDGTLAVLEKDQLDYVKSLGQMQTVATSTRGKLNELTQAYTELSVQYKRLTDEEKKGDFGKALSSSLDQLKTRINDTKAQLNDVNIELGNTKQAEQGTASGIEGLTSALGINLKSLAGWGAALTAGKVALDVVKDAFFASERNIDEWGRTVKSSEAVYDVFLQTLNTGNWSNFFKNLETAVKGARDLYDALDRLGSIKSNNAAAIAIVQQQIAQLRLAKQQGKDVDEQLKQATAQLRALQNQSINAGKTAGLKTAAETIKTRYNAQGGNLADSTANAIVDRIIRTGQAEFDRQKKIYQELTKAGTVMRSGTLTTKTGTVYQTAATPQFDINQLTDEQKKQYKLAKAITEGETQIQKGISAYAQAVTEGTSAAREEFKGNRYALQGTGGKGGKGGKAGKTTIQFADDSIMAQEKLVSDLTQKWKTASGELRDGYLKDLEEAQQKLAEMTGKVKGPDLDAMFPDMSKQNFNTGYAGSAQAKYDSALADLALGPINFDTINTYISGIKGMLKDADLGSELYTSMTEKLKDATTVSTLLQEMMERGLAGADLESTAQTLKEKLLSPEGIDQTAIQPFLDELNKQIEEAGGVGLKLNADTGEVTDDKGNGKNDGEELKKFNDGVGKLTGGLSQVTGGLKAVGVEIPKEVDQVIGVVNGISQIISGVGTIISIFGSTAITANTTAVGLNTAAIGTLIAAIEFNTATNFIPFFAGGGIVPHAAGGYLIPGNNMSGDNVFAGNAWVNSGELVLSKAQQGNLASQLTDAERGIGGGVQPYLDGELLYLGLQAYMRRRGLGEIVTTNG